MFFLWKDSLYKWLLFALLLAALLGTLFYSFVLVLLNFFSTVSPLYLVPGDFPGTIMPYHTGIFSLILSISAFIGWFFSAASRPIGAKLVMGPSIVMLFMDGIILLIAVFTLITGTAIDPGEIIFPAIGRIAYHCIVLCLHHKWQA